MQAIFILTHELMNECFMFKLSVLCAAFNGSRTLNLINIFVSTECSVQPPAFSVWCRRCNYLVISLSERGDPSAGEGPDTPNYALMRAHGDTCALDKGRSVRKHSHHILVTTLFLSSAEFAPSPVTRTITAFLQQITNDSYPADRINTSITGAANTMSH